MIEVKAGVKFTVLRREIYSLFPDLDEVFMKHGVKCVITCGTNGHKANDPHTNGYAIDIRSNHLSTELSHVIYNEIKARLSAEYYFILEDEGTDNEHYHLQIRKDLWPLLLKGDI